MKFRALGNQFWRPVNPVPLATPEWLDLNPKGCELIGLTPDTFCQEEWLALHNGETQLAGEMPLCSVYSGHQFGVWAGQLGDGRAHILGEINGLELQLKGSGLTPFSRMGDGRAVLRSSIREYLAGEYLHALGIPTTRSLGITMSQDPVVRETVETGSMMIRLSPSFVRFGTVEHFFSIGNTDAIDELLAWLMTHFYPDCYNPQDLFRAIVQNTAEMIAGWMVYGFCHGVMNTDNMSLLGLTLDYGPYGFLDVYDPTHICNHSDHNGRYSFQNQPGIAQWNLMALAVALQHTLDLDWAETIIKTEFTNRYDQQYWKKMTGRFGLSDSPKARQFSDKCLTLLVGEYDHNRFLWGYTNAIKTASIPAWLKSLSISEATRDALIHHFENRSMEPDIVTMTALNPKFVLRNWVAQEVIDETLRGDKSVIAQVRNVLQYPFDEHPRWERFAGETPAWGQQICVSCSS